LKNVQAIYIPTGCSTLPKSLISNRSLGSKRWSSDIWNVVRQVCRKTRMFFRQRNCRNIYSTATFYCKPFVYRMCKVE